MREILSLLVCPDCKHRFDVIDNAYLICTNCHRQIPVCDGKPIFTPIPETAHVYQHIERGPNQGTPWRRANWRFLEEQVQSLEKDAIILDVGAGRGDFVPIYARYKAVSVDIVPYPEVNLVCDLSECIPFCEGSFSVVILMNVLEHVYTFHELLDSLFYLLKPGGKLIIAVPFMIKIHQSPFDFYRYTHYSLRELAHQHGFEISLLEGYYDPTFFMGESVRNFHFWVLPKQPRLMRWIGYTILELVKSMIKLLKFIVGKGYLASPEVAKNPAAIGYHLVLRKKFTQK